VDGRPVGETPIAELGLENGPHRFSARLPDGRVVERTVDVRGTRYNVNFR
jgi:hypothetical protein